MACPVGGCGKQVENNRLLSGVCQPLMSLSSHLEEKQHAAGFYCTGTVTGTGAETASTDRGWGGGNLSLCLVSFYGSMHLACECTPDIFLLGFSFSSQFSLPLFATILHCYAF